MQNPEKAMVQTSEDRDSADTEDLQGEIDIQMYLLVQRCFPVKLVTRSLVEPKLIVTCKDRGLFLTGA